MNIKTPFHLYTPVLWGYNMQSFIYDTNNRSIGSIEHIYTPSSKRILGIELTATSLLIWKTKENTPIAKISIKTNFPLIVENKESNLTIRAKTFSILPSLEFIDKNSKIIFSTQHTYKSTIFISPEKRLQYKMHKIKSTKKGYVAWEINSLCEESMIDYRLVFGYIATLMMDTGSPG